MEEAIDEGPILRRDVYPAREHVEIDRVLDPLVRSQTLLRVLIETKDQGAWAEGFQPDPDEFTFTYYVVHPLLKHLVLQQQGLCS